MWFIIMSKDHFLEHSNKISLWLWLLNYSYFLWSGIMFTCSNASLLTLRTDFTTKYMCNIYYSIIHQINLNQRCLKMPNLNDKSLCMHMKCSHRYVHIIDKTRLYLTSINFLISPRMQSACLLSVPDQIWEQFMRIHFSATNRSLANKCC